MSLGFPVLAPFVRMLLTQIASGCCSSSSRWRCSEFPSEVAVEGADLRRLEEVERKSSAGGASSSEEG